MGEVNDKLTAYPTEAKVIIDMQSHYGHGGHLW